MKRFLLLTLLTTVYWIAEAQYTLVKPNGSLEVSGWLTTFYYHRFYPSGTTDFKKNRYSLDFAVLKLDGVVNKIWNYQLQLNNAALFDPEANDGFLMDANASLNPLNDRLEIKIGWMKLPFSKSSLVPMSESPFLQRPAISRGTFARRDAGLLVRYSLFNKLINVYAGSFTGLGAKTLIGDNDESGNMEFVGRLECSYPARYRRTEVDFVHNVLPVFSLGADVRYANKKTSFGDNYAFEVLDGSKLAYTLNADLAFKGLSVHSEYLGMKLKPNNKELLLTKPTDYFRAGGLNASVNYFFKKYKTSLAIRYDEINPNYLIKGDSEATLSFAGNYHLDGLKSVVKVHYWKRIKDKNATSIWAEDQIRLAYQLMF